MKSAYSLKIDSVNRIATGQDLKLSIGKRSIKITIFLFLGLWCLGFTYASLFPQSKMIVLYPLVKQFYSTVCHQIAYKSIEINGFNFLVCARCSGIYFGGLLSSIIFLFFSVPYSFKISYIFIAAIPMAADVILYSIGIYSYSKIIALATGFLFGFFVVSFILISLENFFIKRKYKDQ
jgi:uncharacterized membrane protein